VSGLVVGSVLVSSLFCPVDFARLISRFGCAIEIRRDYAASVISAGAKLDKRLFVNGIGVTALTPETKFMAHCRLLCMLVTRIGAHYLLWDGHKLPIGVELEHRHYGGGIGAQRKESIGFYHQDAARILNNPKGRIVIDDGRRY